MSVLCAGRISLVMREKRLRYDQRPGAILKQGMAQNVSSVCRTHFFGHA